MLEIPVANRPALTYREPEVKFVKPPVLSFSTSRYPSTTFGQFIRRAQLKKGLKQRDVAEMVGVDEMTIVKWERYATVPMRSHRKILCLCEALGIKLTALPLSEISRRFPWGAAVWRNPDES